MKKNLKYLWILVLLPLLGFAPAHVDVGAGYMVEHSEETMTWYQCRAEVRRVNKEMERMTTGAERPVISMRCHFGSGE
ncbi:MAG: hypothetical protein O7F72_08630 [Proteobacteria bacterium]|nr:hypothetical protein [Pseudomonadota bacterium]